MSNDAHSTTDENGNGSQRAFASLGEISDARTGKLAPPASSLERAVNTAACMKSPSSVFPLLDEGPVQSPVQQRVVEALEGGGPTHIDVKTSSSRFGLSARMFIYCFIGAVCGSLPRAITLAISRTFPSVDVVEGVNNFKNLWAPCHENDYPGTSPGGLFHKYIIISDHFWTYFAIILCYGSSLKVLFPHNTRATR